MSDETNSGFTATELSMIALVLNQNADQYADDAQPLIRQTATKAREMIDDD